MSMLQYEIECVVVRQTSNAKVLSTLNLSVGRDPLDSATRPRLNCRR